MPRVRFGTVHLYNNYYNCTKNNYCIGTGVESRIRAERCYFDTVKKPWNDMKGMARNAEIGWEGHKFVDADVPDYAPNKWPVFEVPYKFTMDKVDDVNRLVTDPVNGAGNCMTR
jgi:pectate lyase